jgi:hypothetical protein
VSTTTAKQWERRALTADQELETIRAMRKQDSERDLTMARENAALRVAMREIQEASNWAFDILLHA